MWHSFGLWSALALAGALFLLLFVVPVEVGLTCCRRRGDRLLARLRVRYGPLGLRRGWAWRAAAPPAGPIATERADLASWWRWGRQGATAAAPLYRWARRRLLVRRFALSGELGLGDPVSTALACGGAWAAAGTGMAVLQNLVRLAPGAPVLAIRPRFRKHILRFDAECIITFCPGHLITVLPAVWWQLRQAGMLKGARFGGGSSHSGSDADGDGVPQRDGRRQHGDR